MNSVEEQPAVEILTKTMAQSNYGYKLSPLGREICIGDEVSVYPAHGTLHFIGSVHYVVSILGALNLKQKMRVYHCCAYHATSDPPPFDGRYHCKKCDSTPDLVMSFETTDGKISYIECRAGRSGVSRFPDYSTLVLSLNGLKLESSFVDDKGKPKTESVAEPKKEEPKSEHIEGIPDRYLQYLVKVPALGSGRFPECYLDSFIQRNGCEMYTELCEHFDNVILVAMANGKQIVTVNMLMDGFEHSPCSYRGYEHSSIICGLIMAMLTRKYMTEPKRHKIEQLNELKYCKNSGNAETRVEIFKIVG